MRVVVRGYVGERVKFTENVEVPEDATDAFMLDLVQKHANEMASHELHMIELYFPDCPPEDQYFRIGTDPRGMVNPIGVRL